MAKARKVKKILFFTEGVIPSEEEYAAFDELGPGAVMRRADLVRADEALEAFDEVAGAVPASYAAKAEAMALAAAESPAKDAPKADPSSVPPASPVAPPAAPAKPVAPPKGGSGGGWKPNA